MPSQVVYPCASAQIFLCFVVSVCAPQVFQDIEDLQVAARRKQGDVATAANKAVAADIDAFLKSI